MLVETEESVRRELHKLAGNVFLRLKVTRLKRNMKKKEEEEKEEGKKGKEWARMVKGEKCERDVLPRGGFRQEFRMLVQLAWKVISVRA